MALDVKYRRMMSGLDVARLVETATHLARYGEKSVEGFYQSRCDSGHGREVIMCMQPQLGIAYSQVRLYLIHAAEFTRVGFEAYSNLIPDSRDLQTPAELGNAVLQTMSAIKAVRRGDRTPGENELMNNVIAATAVTLRALGDRCVEIFSQ